MGSSKIKPLTARERALALAQRFRKIYPDAHCELDFGNPLQLLIATILSAQCTDKRVNMVTPALFKKYPDARAFAKARPATFESEIRSTGFFQSKREMFLSRWRNCVRCPASGEKRRTLCSEMLLEKTKGSWSTLTLFVCRSALN